MSASLMLICAVLASLAFGVLVAYGICQMMFCVLRGQSMNAARQRERRASEADIQVA